MSEKPMTVKQLREVLDGVPDDTEVWTTCVAYSGGVHNAPVLKVESELKQIWAEIGPRLVLVIEDW